MNNPCALGTNSISFTIPLAAISLSCIFLSPSPKWWIQRNLLAEIGEKNPEDQCCQCSQIQALFHVSLVTKQLTSACFRAGLGLTMAASNSNSARTSLHGLPTLPPIPKKDPHHPLELSQTSKALRQVSSTGQ